MISAATFGNSVQNANFNKYRADWFPLNTLCDSTDFAAISKVCAKSSHNLPFITLKMHNFLPSNTNKEILKYIDDVSLGKYSKQKSETLKIKKEFLWLRQTFHFSSTDWFHFNECQSDEIDLSLWNILLMVLIVEKYPGS